MRKIAPFVGESSDGNGAVSELASFLARMEGAAEVSADHVASAKRITTGTTLEEGFDALSDDEIPHNPVGERPVAKGRVLRKRPTGSRAAVVLLLAFTGCIVASRTQDEWAPPTMNLAANSRPSVASPKETVPPVSASLPPPALAPAPSVDSIPSAAPGPTRDRVPASVRGGPEPPSSIANPDLNQAEMPRGASVIIAPAQRQAIERSPNAVQPTQPASLMPQSLAPLPLLSLPLPPLQAHVAPLPLPSPTMAERSAPVPLSQNVMVFMRRADRLIELGDISGARLLYERAAGLGSGTAAFSMGRTFDPLFLSALGASIPPDEAKSAEWYRRAVVLGSVEAAASLRLLDHRMSR